MTELSNFTNTKDWLENQPHNTVLLFAARAALRNIPFMWELTQDEVNFRNNASDVILPSFYALLRAIITAKWPKKTASENFSKFKIIVPQHITLNIAVNAANATNGALAAAAAVKSKAEQDNGRNKHRLIGHGFLVGAGGAIGERSKNRRATGRINNHK